MGVRVWVGLVLVLGVPALARADEAPLPPPATDLAGPKALALGGALRANGNSNDAIYLNPAGILAVQRYTFSAQGLHDLNGGQDSFGAVLSDSTSGPIAASVAANRLWLGPSSANAGTVDWSQVRA